MINLFFYKNFYFNDKLIVSSKELYDNFRNIGIKNSYKIDDNKSNNYLEYDSLDLLKLLFDKVFFYKVDSQSIKNMLYQNGLFYQDFKNSNQIESFFYRLINEDINRVLIFTNNFSNKNNPIKITKEQKEELINNIDNDVIYLSDNIILVRHNIFLPYLWTCKKEELNSLKNISESIYFLENKWDFSN